MSTALAVRDVALARNDVLARLGERARHEHRLALEKATEALEHAIRSGQFLLAARKIVRHGEWLPWLEENFPAAPTTANSYMRIALHQERVKQAGIISVGAAIELLRGETNRKSDEEKVEAARRMRESGGTLRGIARELAVPDTTVRYWLIPEEAAKKRKHKKATSRAEAREAKRLQHRDTMDRVGGQIADAWRKIQELAAALNERAIDEENVEVKRSIRAAITSLYNAEERLAQAAGSLKETGDAAG